jgi:hypothetical protein
MNALLSLLPSVDLTQPIITGLARLACHPAPEIQGPAQEVLESIRSKGVVNASSLFHVGFAQAVMKRVSRTKEGDGGDGDTVQKPLSQ